MGIYAFVNGLPKDSSFPQNSALDSNNNRPKEKEGLHYLSFLFIKLEKC